MLIKAKSLFPNLEYTEEEKEAVSNLEKKLELYKIMMEATKNINKNYSKKVMSSISKFENNESVFVWDERVDTALLHSISIASLRVKKSFSLSFREFSSSMSNDAKSFEEKKSAFIVSFLAMLELIKNGLLNADQTGDHNEISISNINNQTKESVGV